MYREERVRAALAGKEVDRVPVAAWMHLSAFDQNPISLIEKNESEPPLPAKKSTAYRSLPGCTSPHSTRIRSPSPRQKSISQKNMTSTIPR